uniref:Uncharacterized protein n=1 Tax=Trypanosoma vivax (strain Y486) TaxID=1055687 RepID=G0U0Q2_TRYVY|nr:hypothetical protein, unlikely [Trypanosoma vivax Y486]
MPPPLFEHLFLHLRLPWSRRKHRAPARRCSHTSTALKGQRKTRAMCVCSSPLRPPPLTHAFPPLQCSLAIFHIVLFLFHFFFFTIITITICSAAHLIACLTGTNYFLFIFFLFLIFTLLSLSLSFFFYCCVS